MDGSSDDDHGFNNSATVEITGKVMVVAIIVLFLVVVFVLFLHLYAKWFWWRVEQPPPPPNSHRRRRRSRFVFAPGQDPSFTLRTGLDPAVLKSIPVVEEFKQLQGLECAVCLSELVHGEKARLLPKCNHGFHVECIDMWFQSHSTCPLCRNPVDVQQGSMPMEAVEAVDFNGGSQSQESLVSTHESPNFPTNVLFWGNETQVSSGGACLELELEEAPSSSSSSSTSTSSASNPPTTTTTTTTTTSASASTAVVIDIEEEEEEKSPRPPTRLRSFKRLLSREKKVNPTTSPSNCSGGSFDDEQVRRV